MAADPAPTGLPLLRAYQARTFLALARGVESRPGATFTVLFPRQAGKNEVSATLVAFLLLANAARGGTVVVCAPTLHPQGAISHARTVRTLSNLRHLLPAIARPRVAEQSIRIGNASATFLSASPEAHVAGHTASLALIADEAQEIDADWFDRQFRPMAASTGAPAVLFGTPWDGETLLDRAVARNRELDAKARPGEPRLHREVHWPEVAAANPAYGDYVREERSRLGARHPLFLTQYGLQTVADAGRLFSAEDLEALEGSHPREEAPTDGARYVAGLDLGGEGRESDRSILTIARADGDAVEVVAHVSWQGTPMREIGGAVELLAHHWRIERLVVDATGIGQPLAGELKRALGGHVEQFVFTGPSKSELGYALLAAVRNGRLRLYADDGIPESRACRAELAACRSRFHGPALRWGAPPGAHDDYVVSLALCLRAASSLAPPRVAVGRRR
ncbi:MAG: hypothetical protein AB7T37_09405 [Dehalococcoidia bacterium]